MKEIIEKAKEHGYKGAQEPYKYWDERCYVLDPLFWKSLGKACGWNEYKSPDWDDEYIDKAMHFHRINLTDGWDAAIIWLTSLVNEK